MRNCLRWLTFSLCFLQPIICPPANAGDPFLPRRVANTSAIPSTAELREFEVWVDEKPLGSHRLIIKTNKRTQQAKIETDVKVNLVVYAYLFKCRGSEVWRDGKIEEADFRAQDGGKQ